jgi:hypothetical protein
VRLVWFLVVAVDILVEVEKPVYWFGKKMPWTTTVEEKRKATRYYITTANGFNWDIDQNNPDRNNYANMIYDALNANNHVQVKDMPGTTETPLGPLSKVKGWAKSSSLIWLPDDTQAENFENLNLPSIVDKKRNPNKLWSAGGTFIHELMFHIFGVDPGVPMAIQTFYNLPTSREHGNNVTVYKIGQEEQKRLNQQRGAASKPIRTSPKKGKTP